MMSEKKEGTRMWRAMPTTARCQHCFLCGWEPVKCFKQRSNVICFVFQNILKQAVLIVSKIHISMLLHRLSPGISFLNLVYLSVSPADLEI